MHEPYEAFNSSDERGVVTFLKNLAYIQDKLSHFGFVLAACVLAIISLAYCYEVVSRYFFNAPTIWASPLVSYALCITIFLALPDLARRGLHISIDLHESWLSPKVIEVLKKSTNFVAAIFCLAAAWITAEQAWSEFMGGVMTNSYVAIPKWWVFIFIPYGFLNGGIYFLRQTFGEVPHASEEAVL
jgi:TRAP-type C4-dicarboxylate transport system permease small subunit